MRRKFSIGSEVDLSTVVEATICGISQHPRRPDRYFVRLEADGEFVHKLLITDEALVQLNLKVGQVIHTGFIAQLVETADLTKAFDSAVNSLAFKGRARLELQRLLQRKGLQVIHIEPALDKLEALGVINDTEFARSFVRAKVFGRGTSVMALRRDLGRKGVPREIASAAIDEVMAEQSVDESDVARTEAAKRWRALSKLEPEVAKRRLIGFLQRRGFGGDIVRTVVRELTGR